MSLRVIWFFIRTKSVDPNNFINNNDNLVCTKTQNYFYYNFKVNYRTNLI